jgi:hypothetical protein
MLEGRTRFYILPVTRNARLDFVSITDVDIHCYLGPISMTSASTKPTQSARSNSKQVI